MLLLHKRLWVYSVFSACMSNGASLDLAVMVDAVKFVLGVAHRALLTFSLVDRISCQLLGRLRVNQML